MKKVFDKFILRAFESKKKDDGTFALIDAAHQGLPVVCTSLLDKGYDVNIIYQSRITPLIMSAIRGHIECARILIERGADVNRQDRSGRTAFDYAAIRSDYDFCKLLVDSKITLDREWPVSYLPEAVAGGNIAICKLLMENGASIHFSDVSGKTLLMYAILEVEHASDRIEMVKFLIQEGIDLNSKDSKGKTALKHAEKKGYQDICQIIQDAPSSSTSIANVGVLKRPKA